ncbi:hypothetical protein L950_0201990 [Sphingobacterium sp. IITKGP-BTPF85]|nr:hypothetical protein L950_0201990 [Sphingobacterium sp. IITKGP-BTPF85]
MLNSKWKKIRQYDRYWKSGITHGLLKIAFVAIVTFALVKFVDLLSA